ncbi:MAG: serine protease [Candidatus Cloacimonas sp.]
MEPKQKREELLQQLETLRKTKVLIYVTGDRPGWETQIHQEVHSFFAQHLEKMSKGSKLNKLSLFLYTRGGNTLAAWSLVNLLRQYCEELEIIVPSKAHSAGTLMCLGSNLIVMTRQSTLGPIDPNINTPLNPAIPNMPGHTIPVSVEAINGYIELVKKEFGIKNDQALAEVVKVLSEKIHPLVLGEVYRARAQIKMLANKLLDFHIPEGHKEKIVNFLCTDSGSHDYTINIKDARDLGLVVEEADQQNAELINAILETIARELELDIPFDPKKLLKKKEFTDYWCKRALIQSIEGGKHLFISEGTLSLHHNEDKVIFQNTPTFEGWRYAK